MTVEPSPFSEPDVGFFVDLERAVWDALVAGDPSADEACLSEDFVGVYPSGFAGRNDHAKQLSNGPTVVEYEFTRERILVVAPDHVMLSYLARYRRPDADVVEEMHVSSLWSQRDGAWLNVFSQDTPVGPPVV